MARSTVAVLLLVTALALTPAAFAETIESRYTGAFGFGVGPHAGGLVICESGCQDETTGTSLPALGGAMLPGPAKKQHTNLRVTIHDDQWGADTAASLCVVLAGSETCDDYTPAGCGLISSIGDRRVDRVIVQVYTLYVAGDLRVCGGTEGAVQGTYFN